MVFVFNGEKKNMALLILVVVFGTTFGASLIKNQLEVCHLLEGTQDDLATRNSSNAKAENWKEETVEKRIKDSVRTQDPLWTNFKLKEVRNKSDFKLTFAECVSYARNYSDNETPSIDQFNVVDGKRLTPSSKIAYQSYSFLKELGNACTKSKNFTFMSLINFCINVDKLVSDCPRGDCNVVIPALSLEEWKELFALKLRIDNAEGERLPEFELPPKDDYAYFDFLHISCLEALYQNLRRGLSGVLNFFSYDTIIKFSLFFFFLVVANLGHLYLFERPEYNTRVSIQAKSSETIWMETVRKAMPDKQITFSKRRVNGDFVVICNVIGNHSSVRYRVISQDSYERAFLYLALRFPKRGQELNIQGVLRAIGINETVPLRFLKSLVFFAYAFWRSRNVTDRIVAVTQWLDTLLDLSYEQGVDIRLSNFYTLFHNLTAVKANCDKFYKEGKNSIHISVNPDGEECSDDGDYTSARGISPDPDDEILPEGYVFKRANVECQGLEENAEQLATFFKGVFNSSSIKASFRLISLIWHLLFVFKDGKIDWDHLTKWDTAVFTTLPEKSMNLGQVLLEQISNLATASWEFYKTRDMNVFLRNDNEVTAYMESVEAITAEIKRVPIEPALNASLQDLELRLRNLIVKGETLRPRVKLGVRPAFTSGLLQLRSLMLELNSMARASSSRPAPFTLLINGTPKIGKSSITAMIFKRFQLTNPYHTVMKTGLELPDGGIYTRTLKEEYWSCYMNSYWGILYDDIGQTNPKCPEFSLEINEIIQVVNNVMFYPQMAIAEEKGKRYVAPQIVLATSNNKDLNAHHAVRSAGAVLRRFPFVITPTVRPEFSTDGTLDPNKIGDDEMDLWTFVIEEVVLTNKGQSVTYRTIQKDISTAELMNWVDKQSSAYFENQSKADGFLKKVSEVKVCEVCKNMMCFCTCLRPVPAVEEISSDDVPDLVVDSDSDPDVEPEVVGRFVPIANRQREGAARRNRRDRPEPVRARRNPRQVDGAPAPNRRETSTRVRIQAMDVAIRGLQAAVSRRIYAIMIQYGMFWLFFKTAYNVFMMCLFLDSYLGHPIWWLVGMINQRAWNIGFSTVTRTQAAAIYRVRDVLARGFTWNSDDVMAVTWMMGWYNTLNSMRQAAVATTSWVNRNPKTIAAILLALGGGAFAVWYYSQTCNWKTGSIRTQGLSDDIPTGTTPPEPDSNVENTWKTSGRLSFGAYLPEKSKTGNPEWFKNTLEHSIAQLGFSGVNTTIIGLNVFGQYWLVPLHFMRLKGISAAKVVTLTRASSIGTNMATFTGAFDMSMVKMAPDADYALIHLSTPPGPNLLPYVVNPGSGTRWSAVNLFMREEGLVTVPSEPILFGSGEMVEAAVGAGLPPDHKFSYGKYKSVFQTLNGDCGSPCVVLDAGRLVILGTHIAIDQYDESVKMVNTLPLNWLKEVLATDASCVVQGTLDLDCPGKKPIELNNDVHPKCPLRFEGLADMPNGNSATPIGAFKGLALNRLATRVHENLFAPFWKSAGYVTSKVRPVLSSVNVGSWMPKRNFLMNVCQHKDLIPACILQVCASHYLSSFISKVPIGSVRKCVIVDEETNLHGAENNNFISHMKFDTGAGFPYNKPKFEVLERIEHERFPDGTCALPPFMKKRIDGMERIAAEGKRINFVFNSSLKDEPISKKKLEAGKIRVFQAICVEGLFLLRKYFLSIIALFQTWNFASEAAIGMDATGPDWDDLHDYIFRPGWKIFCGDYSNYDQRMGSSIMLKAWWIVIEIARLSGNYPYVAIRIMWVLAVECCFCVVNFFGDLLVLNGSNPSGHGLTVVINSICNSLYMRVAWYDIFGNLDDFLLAVAIMTYGDDNIISVHPDYQERFNQVTVTQALAKYGIVYTDALKTGAAAKPFCDLSEISFLKRGFVEHEHDGHKFWLAPLEVESIHKMLIIGVNQNKVPEKDRLASVLISSVMEAFQHGKEFYDEHLNLAIQCMHEYDLKEWVASKGGLPAYQSLMEKRLAKISRLSSLEVV